jgi:hypothetical protein
LPVAFHHQDQRQAILAVPAEALGKPAASPSGLVNRLQYRRWFEPAQSEPMMVVLPLEFILQLVNSQKRATV